MRSGKFEVTKDVYDRAKAGRDKPPYYLTKEDEEKLFTISERIGYGLYGCSVREEDGKYMCYYSLGDSCD